MLEICPYDPHFVDIFRRELDKISSIIDFDCRIEHIGSTSIPGMVGKGVIDIMVAFNSKDELSNGVNLLKNYYYLSEDNSGRNGRIFMRSSKNESTAGDIHLHLLTKDNPDLFNVLLFRNFLINNPDDQKAYAELKYMLKQKVGDDRKKYTELKNDFIKNIIDKAKKQSQIINLL